MPSSGASSTTVLEASPNAPSRKARSVSSASASLSASTTPFPAARPSAFRTMGRPQAQLRISASPETQSPTVTEAAAGRSWRSMKSFAKAFDPSSLAVAAPWPKTGMPSARTASATPATSGASGPMTTRPGRFAAHQPATAFGSAASMATRDPSSPSASLPGADTSSTPAVSLSLSARACSRPPEPSSRIFMEPPILQYRRRSGGPEAPTRTSPSHPASSRAGACRP